MNGKLRSVWCVWTAMAACVVPFIVMSQSIVFSRSHPGFASAGLDTIVWWTSLASGLGFVLLLPVKPVHRLLAVIGYVPAMLAFLLMYVLSFVCSRFGDCL